MSGHSRVETEVKLRLEGPAQGRRLLHRAGFRMIRRRLFESNTVFDTAGKSLRRSGALLRLREIGRRTLLTYKGPATPGRHKSREELEMRIFNGRAFAEILSRLGFEPVFRYQKYRTEYAEPRHVGLATLDETPIGTFLELEGAPEWIDREALRLGFAQADYISSSYASLYQDYQRRHRESPADMVFVKQ